MNELSLLYFDIDGGRAEPIRLALHFGQIEFDDVRFPMKSFPEVKATTPFGQVPTLTVNGQVITQTNAILRFVGQQVGLYPDDLMKALLVDEVLDVVEDMIDKMVATFGMKGEALESARASLLEGPYRRYLEWMSDRLVAQGEGFFAGTELSIADLKTWVWLKTLMSGMFDHIPEQWLAEHYPLLAEYTTVIAQHPCIASYYHRVS